MQSGLRVCLLFAALGALGCEARLSLGAGCSRSSECAVGLVCGVGGRCRSECETTRDCSLGAWCLVDQATGIRACSIPTSDACTSTSTCPGGLRCVDGACLNACVLSDECPDRRCVGDVCRPPSAADAGEPLPDAGPRVCAALPAPGDRITHVSVGIGAVCAVAASGAVWCWGYWPNVVDLPDWTAFVPFRVLSSDGTPLVAENVALGDSFGCAILPDASVRCWGDVDGQGGPTARAERVLRATDGLPLAGATAITAGRFHACALVGTEAWCWGRGDPSGALGDGLAADREVAAPATELGTNVDVVAAGYARTFALSGMPPALSLVGVGEDDQGELGGAAPTAAPGWAFAAVSSPITDFDVLAVGAEATCILRSGAPLCWGTGPLLGTPSVVPLEGCGGSCTTTPRPIEVELSTPLAGLVADWEGHTAIGWSMGGALFGWGSNEDLGLQPDSGWSLVERALPLPAFTGTTHVVSLGAGTACAIEDGSGELWCWGSNGAGQLGRGYETPAEGRAERVCWPEP